MTPEDLARLHPYVYHLAELSALEGLRRAGLLSTEHLLKSAGVSPAKIIQLTRAVRPQSVEIESERLGAVTIRDNRPMSTKMLTHVVEGTSVPDFLAEINRRVFFWPTRERLDTFMKAYPGPRLLMQFDTLRLTSFRWGQVSLSPINSGAVRMVSHKRGPWTFAPASDLDFDLWRGRRTRRKAIAEVCISGHVQDPRESMVGCWTVGDGPEWKPIDF